MRIVTNGALTCALALGPALGCAMKQKETLKEVTSDAPVNCSTAEGDIRVLESEKTHVAQQILEGATSITPAGAVLGIRLRTQSTAERAWISLQSGRTLRTARAASSSWPLWSRPLAWACSRVR